MIMRTEHYTTLIAVLAILAMGVILALSVLYPKGLPQSAKTVTVSASGSSSALPQDGVLDIYANGTGGTAGIATSNLSLTLAQVNETLLKYTTANQVRTQYYNLGMERNSSVFIASEGLHVIIPEVGNTTAALMGLSSLKNVYVQDAGAMLSSRQVAALREAALRSALRNATAQAETLTGNATLTTSNMTTSTYRVYEPLGLTAGSSVSNPAKEPSQLFFNGNESIVESVSVTFTYG